MRSERLQIFFRHMQLQFEGNNVVVQCDANGNAVYVPGAVAGHEWKEFTKYIEGLGKLSLEWSATSAGNADGGETNEVGSNYDKGISLEITISDKAFEYVYDWLLKTPCSLLNAVEVKIVDLVCKNQYRLFEIKADNLTYKPDDAPCEFEVRMREQDLTWHCVHKTFIWDNHQHWFEDNSAKEHPCFLTCIEPRPRFISSVKLSLLLIILTHPSIPWWIGLLIKDEKIVRRILQIENFIPAPLVRDYLKNVCDKCGLAMDTMFDDVPGNDYKNLCLYYPLAGDQFWHNNNGDNIESPATWFFFENRWLTTLAEFLDYLKKNFKAEWYVTPNKKLIFKPQIDFDTAAALYDFTLPGNFPRYNLEYTFDGTKKPAYGRYQYQTDAGDMASQEILTLYNDIADYDGPANNPMLEGSKTNNFDFAATGFVRDGRAADYIRTIINDAETNAYIFLALLFIVVVIFAAGFFTTIPAIALGALLGIWIGLISLKANSWRHDFGDFDNEYTGAVRITTNTVNVPRLLLWDGENKRRAKVVRQGVPDPNPYYNPTGIPYVPRNTINQDNVVFNYPMYFDSFYKGNLFDRFHDKIDNPLLSLDTHQSFTFNTDLCCEVMDVFGLWDGDFPKIGYVIKLEGRDNHGIFGKITGIAVNQDDEKVEFKGKVLKRKN